MSNTLKHAFNPGELGEVTVGVQSGSEGQVVFWVHDNGTGLPPEIPWRQVPSLGLQLVQMLTAQIGEQVELHNSPGQRVEFRVEFTVHN